APLRSRLASLKAGDDLGTSVIPQLVTQHLLGRIDEARQSRNDFLEQARDACIRAVRKHLPGWELIEPTGGASLWVQLPHGSATTLAQLSEREGALLFAGPVFSAAHQQDDHVRIAFSGPADRVLAGVAAIGRAWLTLEQSGIRAEASIEEPRTA